MTNYLSTHPCQVRLTSLPCFKESFICMITLSFIFLNLCLVYNCCEFIASMLHILCFCLTVSVIDGEVFHILKVSRLHMGAYLCIASNGIPPSISKRIEMKVQFPPMMTIPHQLEGAYVGQEVTLECHTEAHPKSINYWTNERGDMIISGKNRIHFN